MNRCPLYTRYDRSTVPPDASVISVGLTLSRGPSYAVCVEVSGLPFEEPPTPVGQVVLSVEQTSRSCTPLTPRRDAGRGMNRGRCLVVSPVCTQDDGP